MVLRIVVFASVFAILTGCAAGSMTATLPTPQNVNITPPPDGLAPDLAAFSGTWEGIWDGVLLSRLIVETIDAESARVVYVWADDPGGGFKGGWTRARAKVLPGGKLQWGSELKFTFQMAKDRLSIEGERERAGRINTITMKKVGP